MFFIGFQGISQLGSAIICSTWINTAFT